MDNCKHTVTQGRDGEKGFWCVNCGVKVFEVEARSCGNCKHIREAFRGFYCGHHRMNVSRQMHVTYKVIEGTCFDPVKNPIASEQINGD